MIATLLLSVALAQGPGPLERADSLLAAADTAAAIDLLAPLARDTAHVEDEARAIFALLWLGRSERWNKARDAWQDLGRFWGDPNVGTAVTLSVAAEAGRADSADIVHAEVTLEHADQLTPAVSASLQWALSQSDIRYIARRIRDHLPHYAQRMRRPAPGGGGAFAVRDSPPEDWTFGAVARADTDWVDREGLHHEMRWHLERAHELLEGLLSAPWPFSEMGARGLLGLSLMFDEAASRAEVRREVHGIRLNARSQVELDAALFLLQGQHDSASQVVQRHPSTFIMYDSMVTPLAGRGALAPPVLWRTGWPLYLQGYNERLTVHRVRYVVADILDRFVPRFPSVLREFADPVRVVRGGVPIGAAGSGGDHRLIIYYDERSRETLLYGHEPGTPLDLDVALAARVRTTDLGPTGFVAQQYDSMVDLPHQVVSYARDGRAMIDFYGQPPKPVADCDPNRMTGFYLLDDHLAMARRSVDNVASATGPMHYLVDVNPGAYVYSLEMLDKGCRQAARARYTFRVLQPSRSFSMSANVALATEVHGGLVQRVRGQGLPITPLAGLTVPAGKTVQLYWEVYGLRSASDEIGRLAVDVDAVDLKSGQVPIRELAAVQQKVQSASATGIVHWLADVPAGQEPLGMSIAIELPADHLGVAEVRVRITDQKTLLKAESKRVFLITYPY